MLASSNKRKDIQKEKIDRMVREISPFAFGEAEFDRKELPHIGNNSLEAVLTLLNLKELLIEVQNRLSKSAEGEIDEDILATSQRDFDSVNNFIEAILRGKPHPLLDFWERRRGEVKSKDASPKKKAWRRHCATFAISMTYCQPSLEAGKSYEVVAQIVRETGCSDACNGSTVMQWRNQMTPGDEIDAKMTAEHLGFNSRAVSNLLTSLLLAHRPNLGL